MDGLLANTKVEEVVSGAPLMTQGHWRRDRILHREPKQWVFRAIQGPIDIMSKVSQHPLRWICLLS